MLHLNFFEPEYFHREYENDLDKNKPYNQSIFDQCLRITKVTLPFIGLYKPISQPLTLVLGVVRSISCISQLANVLEKGETVTIGLAVLQTAISVSTVACTIFSHPSGMLITTGQDLILNTSQLITALAEKNSKKTLEIGMQLANNLLYLGLFFTGAPQALIASTACQVLIGMYQSMDEFKKGNYLEGCGYLLMSNIRTYQLYMQVPKFLSQKHDGIQKVSKRATSFTSLLPGTQKDITAQQVTAQKTKEIGGTAFTCPAAKWSGLQSDFYYHFTLTHISTQDPKIVQFVRNDIEAYIIANVPLNNGHRSLSWIQPGISGVNSLFFKGEVADFKWNLHNHLVQDSKISTYISPYIDAHVDVKGDFSKKLYNTFTLDQIIERKTI